MTHKSMIRVLLPLLLATVGAVVVADPPSGWASAARATRPSAQVESLADQAFVSHPHAATHGSRLQSER